jgi:hypothetical protein
VVSGEWCQVKTGSLHVACFLFPIQGCWTLPSLSLRLN